MTFFLNVLIELYKVMLKVKPQSGSTPYSLVSRLAKSTEEEIKAIGRDVRVLAYPMTSVKKYIFNIVDLKNL